MWYSLNESNIMIIKKGTLGKSSNYMMDFSNQICTFLDDSSNLKKDRGFIFMEKLNEFNVLLNLKNIIGLIFKGKKSCANVLANLKNTCADVS